MGLASAWVELSLSLGHYMAYCSPEKIKYELTTHQQFFFPSKSSANLLLIPHACQYIKSYNSQVGMGKIHQDYRVFHFSFLKFLPTISGLDFQQDAATRCLLYQTKPFHINSIYYEQVNTPPSTIFQFIFRTRLHLGWYQFMYVISHIYYFVKLLINLKFCMMRFLSEVIPLILLMLPFKNILDRGCHFDPLSGFF